MRIPQGVSCAKQNQNQVCKLVKSLYGLRKASRKWYEKLTSLILKLGYVQSNVDYSMFTFKKKDHITILIVYVDDIILAGTSLMEFDHIKYILDENFKIQDLWILKYFLSLEVAHFKDGIAISQRKYCLNMMNDTSILHPNPLQHLWIHY